MGGTSMKDVGSAGFAGSSPPFRVRKRAAVDVDVGPERRSPRYHDDDVYYHETCFAAIGPLKKQKDISLAT